MVFLSTLLILSFINSLDSKNIFSRYRTVVGGNDEDSRLADDRDEQYKVADDNGYELLGLVVLDYDTPTRRYMNDNDNMAGANNVEFDVDGAGARLEPRAQSKHKKKGRVVEKPKHKKDRENEEDEEEEVVIVKKKVDKKVKPLRILDSEERETDNILRGLSAQCVTDMEKKRDKCTMACYWSHEDVCDRLTCSVRAQIAFRKECEYNCRNIFDHSSCL